MEEDLLHLQFTLFRLPCHPYILACWHPGHPGKGRKKVYLFRGCLSQSSFIVNEFAQD